MKWIRLSGSTIEISSTPVTRAEYLQFARETGRPIPHHGGSLDSPVTQVRADDAGAFAEWLSCRDGRHYRLPTLEEIRTLAHQARNGVTSVTWPSRWQDTHNGRAPEYLNEWLGCSADWVSQPNRLHCVTHPAWLLTEHHTLPHGALDDRSYSFVTFRLARTAST